MRTREPDAAVRGYFAEPAEAAHRQYLAMRRFLLDEAPAAEVAAEFGYAVSTVYTLARDLKARLAAGGADPYFRPTEPGRPRADREGGLAEDIVALRKRQLSVPEIKAVLDSRGMEASEGLIWSILDGAGFARLPKRSRDERRAASAAGAVEAPEAGPAGLDAGDSFTSAGPGILAFLPIIRAYGIDEAIESSGYPGTGRIGTLESVLAFLALKLSDVARYAHDDAWCMDRGTGLFAGLSVLPKTTWYSTYSSAVTREQNAGFLQSLNSIWAEHGLLSGTANLDFTAIPYWGDGDHLENNWSGKRSKALASIQAVLAQDPESGIICYGDTTVRHDNQNEVVLEFLDFYRKGAPGGPEVTHLVFDSRFTTLGNLGALNGRGICFVTIQRRSKGLDAAVAAIPEGEWKTAKVPRANGRSRTILYCEGTTVNPRYGEEPLRQVFVRGSRINPATILTNDFGLAAADVVRKYAQRWLVENGISEQIHFFHLNRNSSGIVVKVDFDLTMTMLAHNLYRLLAMTLPGYSHMRASTIFNSFIDNHGTVDVTEDSVVVRLNRKRTLPLLRESMSVFEGQTYPWLGGRRLVFEAASHS